MSQQGCYADSLHSIRHRCFDFLFPHPVSILLNNIGQLAHEQFVPLCFSLFDLDGVKLPQQHCLWLLITYLLMAPLARAQIWQPLDPTKRQIRLVELDPSPNVDAIPTGRLVIKSLDRHPVYDAISHAWGGPQPSLSLYLHGFRVPITVSLYSCLRHLRHTSKAQLFWVDALSINQFDITERGQQVQQMEHIFRNAMKVRVWLGDYESIHMPKVLSVVKQIASGVTFERAIWDQKPLTPSDAEHLALVTKSAWFRRLWVKQELALARHVTFHYSHDYLDLNTLLRFQTIFNESGEAHQLVSGTDAVEASFHSTSMLADLEYTSTLLSGSAMGSDPSPKDSALQILLFMWGCRSAQVQDVRDRIYGLTGIFSALFDDDDLVKVDYGLTPHDVFTNFSFNFIRTTNTLVILNQTDRDQNSLANLPSWVTDWSSNYDFGIEAMRFRRLFDVFHASAKHSMPPPKIDEAVKCLGLRGYVFDNVQQVGSVCEGEFNRRKLLVPNNEISGYLSSWENESWVQDKPAMFARTVVRDAQVFWKNDQWTRGSLGGDGEAERFYHKERDVLAKSPGSSVLVWSILRSALFISTSGRLGLGPPDTQVGDFLAIIPGGDVPYMLRKSTNAVKQNLYAFVGECYVHGVMYGELVKAQGFPGFEDIWLE